MLNRAILVVFWKQTSATLRYRWLKMAVAASEHRRLGIDQIAVRGGYPVTIISNVVVYQIYHISLNCPWLNHTSSFRVFNFSLALNACVRVDSESLLQTPSVFPKIQQR